MSAVQSRVGALRELAEPKLNYAVTTSREGVEKSIAALKAAFDVLATAAASRDLTELEQELRRLVAEADKILTQCVSDLRERTAPHVSQLRERYEEVVTTVESGAARVREAVQRRVSESQALVSEARTRVTAATDSAVASAQQAATQGSARVRTELKQLGEWADEVVARARAAAAEAVVPAERWAGDARNKLEGAGAQLRSQVEPQLTKAQGWVETRSPEGADKLALSAKEARAVLSEGFSVQALTKLFVALLLVIQAVLFLAHPSAAEWSVWGPSPPPSPVAEDVTEQTPLLQSH